MITLYDTGDEVLAPVKITTARKMYGRIFYEVKDFYDKDGNSVLLPEGLIEGKAKIGEAKYYQQLWEEKKCSEETEYNNNKQSASPAFIMPTRGLNEAKLLSGGKNHERNCESGNTAGNSAGACTGEDL